jgi:hypothetical protein
MPSRIYYCLRRYYALGEHLQLALVFTCEHQHFLSVRPTAATYNLYFVLTTLFIYLLTDLHLVIGRASFHPFEGHFCTLIAASLKLHRRKHLRNAASEIGGEKKSRRRQGQIA